MTLRRCYRATCDAPGCTASEMLPHEHTEACREQLEALGWTTRQARTVTSGAPRILYACPAHHPWKPAPPTGPRCVCGHVLAEHRGGPDAYDPRCAAAGCGCCLFVDAAPRVPAPASDRDRRRAMLWLLHSAGLTCAELAAATELTRQRVHELVKGYERIVAGRVREATDWREPWARRLRAAGAIP